MTYIAITEEQSNPFAPITSELLKQLRDNPLAIANGSVGAPYVSQAWHPYDGVISGDSDGVLYDYDVDGAISTFGFGVTPGFEYVARLEGLWSAISGGLPTRHMNIEYNIGGTWRLFSSTLMSGTINESWQNRKLWGYRYMGKLGSIRPIYGGDFTGSSFTETNDLSEPSELATIEGSGLQLAPSDRGLPSAVRFRLTSDTYSGGKVFLARRRFWGGI